MSWAFVLVLAATAYGFKVLGLVVIGDRRMPPVLTRCLDLIPVALLAALVAKDAFSVGQHWQLDARTAGVTAAVVAAWRRAPFVVVVVVAAMVTAIVRLA